MRSATIVFRDACLTGSLTLRRRTRMDAIIAALGLPDAHLPRARRRQRETCECMDVILSASALSPKPNCQ